MHLKEIILWSGTSNDYVTYTFKPGVINYITGHPACGKTTFLKIIRYILGCEDSRIDADIEMAVDWVGIIVETDNKEQHIFARKTEGGKKQHGKHCYHRKISDAFPFKYTEPLTPYISPERMSDIWSQLLGLERLSLEEGSDSLSITTRDLLALSLQGYDIIANEDILFDINSNDETAKNLRANLAFLLGFESTETRQVKSEIAKLQREINAENKEIASINQVQNGWLNDLSVDLKKAAQLGIYSPGEAPLLTTIDILREGRNFISQIGEIGDIPAFSLNTDSINSSTNIITRLESEILTLVIKAKDNQERYEAIQSLREKMKLFQTNGQETMSRLELVEWMEIAWNLNQMNLFKPVGETNEEKCRTNESAFKESLHSYQQSVANPDVLNNEDDHWGLQANAIIKKLKETQIEIDAKQAELSRLRTEYSADATAHDERMKLIRLVERIRLTMSMADSLALERKSAQLEQKRIRFEHLKDRLEALKTKDSKLEREVQHLLSEATERLVTKQLGKDRPWTSYPAFDIKKLDLELHEGTRKNVLLGKIGAATNHQAFHVAFIAALQELMHVLQEKHIFTFAAFDVSGRDKDGLIYSALVDSLVRTKNGWQPIVIDMLPSAANLPKDNEYFHQVAVFHENEGICPKRWFPHA